MHKIQLEQTVLFLNWTCNEDEDVTALLPRLAEQVTETQAHKYMINFQAKMRKKTKKLQLHGSAELLLALNYSGTFQDAKSANRVLRTCSNLMDLATKGRTAAAARTEVVVDVMYTKKVMELVSLEDGEFFRVFSEIKAISEKIAEKHADYETRLLQVYMAAKSVCANKINISIAAPGQGKTTVLLLAAAFAIQEQRKNSDQALYVVIWCTEEVVRYQTKLSMQKFPYN